MKTSEASLRGNSEAECQAHNLEVAGSNPAPASTEEPQDEKFRHPTLRSARPWYWGPARDERLEARAKANMVRDYSRGSLRDHISRAESTEELDEIAKYLEKLVDAGKISRSSALKATKLGHKRYLELDSMLVKPARPRGLYVPKDKSLARNESGLILLKP